MAWSGFEKESQNVALVWWWLCSSADAWLEITLVLQREIVWLGWLNSSEAMSFNEPYPPSVSRPSVPAVSRDVRRLYECSEAPVPRSSPLWLLVLRWKLPECSSATLCVTEGKNARIAVIPRSTTFNGGT